jgi:hypothetical protein
VQLRRAPGQIHRNDGVDLNQATLEAAIVKIMTAAASS